MILAAVSWHKYGQTENNALHLKELFMKLAQLDFFWIQSTREYLNYVSDDKEWRHETNV